MYSSVFFSVLFTFILMLAKEKNVMDIFFLTYSFVAKTFLCLCPSQRQLFNSVQSLFAVVQLSDKVWRLGRNTALVKFSLSVLQILQTWIIFGLIKIICFQVWLLFTLEICLHVMTDQWDFIFVTMVTISGLWKSCSLVHWCRNVDIFQMRRTRHASYWLSIKFNW